MIYCRLSMPIEFHSSFNIGMGVENASSDVFQKRLDLGLVILLHAFSVNILLYYSLLLYTQNFCALRTDYHEMLCPDKSEPFLNRCITRSIDICLSSSIFSELF